MGSLLASTSHRRSVPRTVWHRRAPIVIGALCALLLLGCSIDGEAQSAPSRQSLTPRLVGPDGFPRGASPVPAPAVTSVIVDVAGPAGTVEPPRCRAPRVSAEGAAANVGPGSAGGSPGTGSSGDMGSSSGPTAAGGTLTVLIAYAPTGLDSFDSFLAKCSRFKTQTAGASSQVLLRKLPARAAGGKIGTRSYARTVTTGGQSGSLSYAITTLVAQYDGVRVYAEDRRQGANAQRISADLDTLFRRAVAKAWPNRA
ncbi:hypothetical protein [Gordonia sp. (in: high G+C Gram-positive bacteria)]|uniref:hypothetical protein n=1 Tax=Gordonia sp. (in: high G+C Gram-positive bacteria) TaxID=84139 RepID=UPI001DBD847B|nr:hypothetical protein [Gordonia sp. (in: high G+C Gram-positive bacteria)]MCB1293517.1 hypothetical protein [Gordonia sp. (in: high G+C Gram-positive bacteria)]HMS77638.1 hypothetical protein [Gordonia sp. (in: high G+C Gram-positive bacteria)]